MKIEKIDLYPVSVPYKLIERSSRIYRGGVSDIIIKITTDNGIVGWGEATRTASAKVIFETLESMKPILLNSNPWQNLENENNIYYKTPWHWSPITANLAYGGIDMALWDISDYNNINFVGGYMTNHSHSSHNIYIRPGTDLLIIFII